MLLTAPAVAPHPSLRRPFHVGPRPVNPGPAFISAGFAPRPVSYERGLALQRTVAAALSDPAAPGTVLMLEHEPVYTAGRRSTPAEYPADGTPVVQVNRGGKVTWHGPGQLVAYPVIRLAEGVSGVSLVHALEDAIIATIADFGVTGYRVPGRTGVWTTAPGSPSHEHPPAKLAQIGIHVSRRIVTHGLAINCSNDLTPFERFVPCGITDAGVTTLSHCADEELSPERVAPTLQRHLATALAGCAA